MRLLGVDEFKRNIKVLQSLPSEEVVLGASKPIQAEARSNVRRKLHRHPTGQLERDITITAISQYKTEIGVQASAKASKYAKIHEFGGSIKPRTARALFIPLRHGVKPRQAGLVFGEDFVLSQHVRMPARPYLRPAVDTTKKQVANVFAKLIKKEIKGVIK